MGRTRQQPSLLTPPANTVPGFDDAFFPGLLQHTCSPRKVEYRPADRPTDRAQPIPLTRLLPFCSLPAPQSLNGRGLSSLVVCFLVWTRRKWMREKVSACLRLTPVVGYDGTGSIDFKAARKTGSLPLGKPVDTFICPLTNSRSVSRFPHA
ncbi:unnamed protein product [Protopolystoma xenopodis]|uniref:Uncharacterized protein n=1 Tax=Protopolystoma xenopodis TaxID=117903 RepID=A0A3S5CCT7_9PLAT|nr:unnamed protein product [Protopolystoma xenopodis]